MDEDIETRALRRAQKERELIERREAERAPAAEGAETHERCADKAEYLKEKLGERAEAEREAGDEDA
ncbi:MAG: hypothetical protein ACR2NH_09025 [Solirubrobacteraceae bacterium]